MERQNLSNPFNQRRRNLLSRNGDSMLRGAARVGRGAAQ